MANLAAVALVTLAPASGAQDSVVDMRPFLGIARALADADLTAPAVLQAVANGALLIVVGAYIGAVRRYSWPRSLLVGILLSISIETVQYVLHTGRAASLEDVALNSLGLTLGAAVARRLTPVLKDQTRKPDASVPAASTG